MSLLTDIRARDRDLDGNPDPIDNKLLWDNQVLLAEELVEIEHHLHNSERWFGIAAVPTATDWADDTLGAFQAISGNGVYGADADDEAEILGTADTPAQTGKLKFDVHRILVVDTSVGTIYKVRFVWGTGTMADAITAGQYSEAMYLIDAANPQQSGGSPVDIIMPRLDVGTKVWLQCRNATDNATIDFFVGIHEYDE